MNARSFRRDESGTILVFFALCLVPIVMLIALALDVGRAYSYQAKLQNALDGAALAAGRSLQLNGTTLSGLATANTTAKAYFKQHAPTGATVAVALADNNTTVTLTADYTMAAQFAKVFKVDALPIKALAKASIKPEAGFGKHIESVLVLDVSGSMSLSAHIQALQLAGKDFVDITVWSDQSQWTSRVGLVPFASGVAFDNQGDFVTLTGSGVPAAVAHWCVARRTDNSDDLPSGAYNNATRPPLLFQPYTTYTFDNNTTKKCKPTANFFPVVKKFRSDVAALKLDVGSLQAGGDSDGETGMKVAFGMLNPSWFWGARNYDSTTRKIVLLISDAAFVMLVTPPSTGTLPRPFIGDVCASMKQRGIELFTIWFPGNTGAKAVLQDCATDAAHFYDASAANGGDPVMNLAAAVRDVALKISKLRLTK